MRERTIHGLADSVFVATAPSAEIVFSNRYAARVVGQELSEIASEFPIFHRDGRPYSYEERQVPRTLASGKEILDEELFGLAPDGGRITYRCSCWPVRDHHGHVVAAVAVTRDVTEQKRREARLAYLAGLLDNTDDAIVALDAQWYVTVWNKGAERMYGWTAGEVMGRHTLEVAQLDLSYEDRAEVRREAAERGRWRGEVVAHRKDGTSVAVELITVALRDDEGEVTGFLGIHRDISERKRAEEAILERITDSFVAVDREWRYTYVNENALRRMEWRSGGGLTREEVLGQGMWELFPDAVGTEIYDKYHQAMREQRPMEFESYFAPSDEWIEARAYPSESGLSVYYRNVSERKRSEKVLAEVRAAERRRLARDLHDDALQELTHALSLAREEPLAGALKRGVEGLRAAIYDLRLDEQEEELSFLELLESLVALHRSRAAGCEVELDVRDGVENAAPGGRGKDVLRIVGEALTNARHSGASTIRVGAWGSGDGICLEIADDGCGFDPDAPGSVGTGIAGMRERAAVADAELAIRSAPGAGTQVLIELPSSADVEDSREDARVLLVEDHATVREAIAAMFDREPDFTVVGQAASLAEARGMLEDVDVAVLDLGLPDGYGGDLIADLREASPQAQALVLSADLDRYEIARAVESGAAGTLDKTAHLDEVVESVRSLRAGKALLRPEEIVELLRLAIARREDERSDRAAIARLSPREREVLQVLAEGLDSQAIADRLQISIRTERNHIASILAKLEVHSQPQALVFALRYGVVKLR